MFSWFKKRPPEPEDAPPVATDTSPQGVYSKLRQSALTVDRSRVGIPPSSPDAPVWGVLMEMGYDKATITLFTLIDGTTSLYFSNGGGVIGGHGHEPVCEANAAFIAEANRSLSLLKPGTSTSIPTTNQAIFYALTDDGYLTGTGQLAELGSGRHPLARLFHAGDDVLTQLRLLSEGQQAAG